MCEWVKLAQATGDYTQTFAVDRREMTLAHN
jgi:hypothetical protein